MTWRAERRKPAHGSKPSPWALVGRPPGSGRAFGAPWATGLEPTAMASSRGCVLLAAQRGWQRPPRALFPFPARFPTIHSGGRRITRRPSGGRPVPDYDQYRKPFPAAAVLTIGALVLAAAAVGALEWAAAPG